MREGRSDEEIVVDGESAVNKAALEEGGVTIISFTRSLQQCDPIKIQLTLSHSGSGLFLHQGSYEAAALHRHR